MKKIICLEALVITALFAATPAIAQSVAQSGEVVRVQGFITNAIQVLVVLAGTISGGFFTWGGYGYITSSGNPEGLEKSKRTIMYSAIGLSITSGAYILTNIVKQLAISSFGAAN